MANRVTVIIELKKDKKKLKKTINSLERQKIQETGGVQIILFAGEALQEEYLDYCREIASTGTDMELWKTWQEDKIEGDMVNVLQEGQTWTQTAVETLVALWDSQEEELDFAVEKYKEAVEKQNNRFEYVLNQTEKFVGDIGKYFFHKKFCNEIQKAVATDKKLEIIYYLVKIISTSENMLVLESEKLDGKRQYDKKEREWYLSELPEFKRKLQKLEIQAGSEHHAQIAVAYMTQLAESMKDKVEEYLTEEERLQYEHWLQKELQGLENAVINRGNMNAATRKYAFSLKLGKDVTEQVYCRDGKFYYDNLMIYNIKNGNSFVITQNPDEDGEVCGVSYHPIREDKIQFYLTDRRKEYKFQYKEDAQKSQKCMNHIVMQEKKYVCRIPSDVDYSSLYLECNYGGSSVIRLEK